MSARSLSDEERERVRERMRLVVEQQFKGNASAFARALRLKNSAHVSAMLRKEQPTHPGIPFTRQLADHLGITWEELVGDETDQGAAPDPDDPMPRFTAAAKAFLKLPGSRPEAVERVRRGLAKGQHDRPELEWMEEFLDAQRALRYEQLAPVEAATKKSAARGKYEDRVAEEVAGETPRQRAARLSKGDAKK